MKTTNSSKLDYLLNRLQKLETAHLRQQDLAAMTRKTLLTISDIALLFSITSRTAYNWRKKNLIESVVISRIVYFHWPSVIKLMQLKMDNPELF